MVQRSTSDFILGEVMLGHNEVTLVGLGDLVLGEVRLGHEELTLVGLGDFIWKSLG